MFKSVGDFRRQYTISRKFQEQITPIVVSWLAIFFKIKYREVHLIETYLTDHEFDLSGQTNFHYQIELHENGILINATFIIPFPEPTEIKDQFMITTDQLLYTPEQREAYLNEKINKRTIGFKHVPRPK